MKFKILYQLQDKNLDYLANRALCAEYEEDELILSQKAFPMDKLFLIIKGSVSKNKEYLPIKTAGKGFTAKVMSNKNVNSKCTEVLNEYKFFGLAEMLY